MSKDTIIVIVGGCGTTFPAVAEQIAAVAQRSVPLCLPFDDRPPLAEIVVNREIELPNFEARSLREKPQRDWEQRNKPKRRKRR